MLTLYPDMHCCVRSSAPLGEKPGVKSTENSTFAPVRPKIKDHVTYDKTCDIFVHIYISSLPNMFVEFYSSTLIDKSLYA